MCMELEVESDTKQYWAGRVTIKCIGPTHHAHKWANTDTICKPRCKKIKSALCRPLSTIFPNTIRGSQHSAQTKGKQRPKPHTELSSFPLLLSLQLSQFSYITLSKLPRGSLAFTPFLIWFFFSFNFRILEVFQLSLACFCCDFHSVFGPTRITSGFDC
jgi:hypothetical protein